MSIWQTIGLVLLSLVCAAIGAIIGGLYVLWRSEKGRSASALAAVKLLFQDQEGRPAAVQRVANVPAPTVVTGKAPEVVLPFDLEERPPESQDEAPLGLNREHMIEQLMTTDGLEREAAEKVADEMIKSYVDQGGQSV